MKITKPFFLIALGTCFALAMLVPVVSAEVNVLFDGEQTPFLDNTPGGGGAFEKFTATGGGFDYGQITMEDYGIEPGDSPFGTGIGARFWDNATGNKPEAQGDFAAALTEPFRIDIDSLSNLASGTFAEGDSDGNHAIRFRMANIGQGITSESRSAFSISFQANNRISFKYSGLDDVDEMGDPAPNPNDVDTIFSDELFGAQTMTMVANGNVALAADGITPLEGVADYTYTLFGQTRTLHSLHYDVYLNGVLVNDGTTADQANGLQFHTERSSSYFADDGIGRFGLVGSSNTDTFPDYDFDNIVLRTGADIETSTSVLGDFDGDGDVDLDDLDEYIGNVGADVATNPGLAALDLDGDGTVGANDFETHYGTLVETSNGQVGALAGDLDLDGDVDVLDDAAALVNNLGNAVTSWADGDVTGDGFVTVLADAASLVNNIGSNNEPAAAGPAASAIPEPGSLSLLALAGLAAVTRRRR